MAAGALAVAALLSSPDMRRRGAARQQKPRAQRNRRLPPPPAVLDVPNATRLLVIAPHPDDEVLGAGGLMQRVKATGGAVRVVYLTDGDGYPGGRQGRGSRRSADREGLPRIRQAARGAKRTRRSSGSVSPTRSRPSSAFPTAVSAG